ncbi:VWA domain-containing protein [Sphingomonas sp. 3-13AW]|uniref:VWA domain-containing protein n=1 Tax=Sphingomonas sp. 3-13AW TaxID=3050450 RepID=UPI003BB5DA2D
MKVDLSKKAASFRVSLAKKNILKAPTLRVGAAFDESGSMAGKIGGGSLQEAFNQIMGVTIEFDDNGELDCLAFNHKCRAIGVATPANFAGFVSRHLNATGSTCYAPIVRMSTEMFFSPQRAPGIRGLLGGKVYDTSPALMMVLTDGQNDGDDNHNLDRALADAQRLPIFFHFVGVGADKRSFPTIGRIADKFPNVGEVYLPRFDMPDTEVYEQIVTDRLVDWLRKF